MTQHEEENLLSLLTLIIRTPRYTYCKSQSHHQQQVNHTFFCIICENMQTFVTYTLFCMSWFTHSTIFLSSKFPLKQLIVLLIKKYMYTYFLYYGVPIQLSFLSFRRKIKKQVHFHLATQYYSTFQQNFQQIIHSIIYYTTIFLSML